MYLNSLTVIKTLKANKSFKLLNATDLASFFVVVNTPSFYLWFYWTSASHNFSNEYFHSCYVLWII